MQLNSKRQQYPFSRKRVFLSAIIVILSALLALPLLSIDLFLVLYYFIGTFLFTAVTFSLKRRLYPKLDSGNAESDDDEKGLSSWATFLITFFMLIGFIAIPMLLAGLLSGPAWFIVIVSFTSGVSLSEIILYLQSRGGT